jgi:hypothetical protein
VTASQSELRVEWFDPELSRLIPGLVLSATATCVLVSLDDRMCPVAVHPADLHTQPLEVIA